MINIEVVYDHKKKYKDGKTFVGPVEVRIIYNRKSIYINTGVRVHYKNFIGGAVVNQADAPELNKRLRLIVARVQSEVNDCMERGERIDAAEIRRKVWQVVEYSDNNATPLLDWCEEQVETLGLKAGTVKHYKTLMLRLTEFGDMKRWQDVTVENVLKFDVWLHRLTKAPRNEGLNKWRVLADDDAGENKNEDGSCGKGGGALLSDAAVYNYHKCLKRLLNRAVTIGRIAQNPYDRLKGEFRRGDKAVVDYLTDEEMQRFMELKPPVGTEMDVAHDLFVFQMFTGLAYADMMAFDIRAYKKVMTEDGGERWVHTGERVKTGVPYVSQLLPPVVDVLEKYGWKVPQMTNWKYNYCLKALGMVAGIDRPLHSHLARHTFATWMLRHGVPVAHLSKMLGHTNIQQTMRYAKVQPAAIYDEFERVGKLFG